MQTISVFNNISLDGFFVDAQDGMGWAHAAADAEWTEFAAANAQRGNGSLLFGRKTFQMMAAFWPTSEARTQMPEIAAGMERREKVVLSTTLDELSWANSRLVKGDLESEVRRLRRTAGDGVVIMGSGTVIAQLARANLIDSYTFVVVPVVLGTGRTMFDRLDRPMKLKRTSERAFGNGNVVVTYEPA